MNSKEASASGYWGLTMPYRLPDEQWMLDNVLADMRRKDIEHVLVKEGSGVAVWRRGRNGGQQ